MPSIFNKNNNNKSLFLREEQYQMLYYLGRNKERLVNKLKALKPKSTSALLALIPNPSERSYAEKYSSVLSSGKRIDPYILTMMFIPTFISFFFFFFFLLLFLFLFLFSIFSFSFVE